MYRSRSLEKETAENYMLSIRLNQIGPFLGMRAVVPTMKAARRGSIVNISSVAGVKAQSHGLAYNSTKFAVRGMTRAAALELADHGIRVNAVLPGIIDTPSSLRIRP